jgi:hypothetical protein
MIMSIRYNINVISGLWLFRTAVLSEGLSIMVNEVCIPTQERGNEKLTDTADHFSPARDAAVSNYKQLAYELFQSEMP